MIKGPVIAVGVAVGVGADGSAMIGSEAPAGDTGVGVGGEDVEVGAANVPAVTKDHLLSLRIAVSVALLISVVRVAR
jgi:hypothetical protein